MKAIVLAAITATLVAASANAAPLAPATIASTELGGVEQVRLVCDEYGRCYRTRGPRYVQRYYGGDDGYVVRRSYGYYGGPGYYDRGYGTTAADRASGSASAPEAGEPNKGPLFERPFRWQSWVTNVRSCKAGSTERAIAGATRSPSWPQ